MSRVEALLEIAGAVGTCYAVIAVALWALSGLARAASGGPETANIWLMSWHITIGFWMIAGAPVFWPEVGVIIAPLTGAWQASATMLLPIAIFSIVEMTKVRRGVSRCLHRLVLPRFDARRDSGGGTGKAPRLEKAPASEGAERAVEML